MNAPPKIDNAPGLKWRPIKAGYQAIWRAHPQDVKRGYAFKSMRIWESTAASPEPGEIAKAFIAERCQLLHAEVLVWRGGGIVEMGAYDKTWGSLVRCYRTDPDSPYHKKRYATREHYDSLSKRIVTDYGTVRIADTDARTLLRMHEKWSDNSKKVSMGHAMIGMLRTVTTFGATLLKCADCKAIRSDLHDMRVENAKPREHHLTAEQATAIRKHAHTMQGPFRHSVALAQALQFDGTMRQKDILGEWVPIDEPGPLSDVISGNLKWIRGLRGEEIDENFILRHITSKKNKLLTLDLKLCPMVMMEFRLMAGLGPLDQLERGHVPAKGPLIINEQTGEPWMAANFRHVWRDLARACGVPDHIRNMDTRSGAITEALAAGASMEDVRKSATHSNSSMTSRYSRGDEVATAKVLQHRAAHRNKEAK